MLEVNAYSALTRLRTVTFATFLLKWEKHGWGNGRDFLKENMEVKPSAHYFPP